MATPEITAVVVDAIVDAFDGNLPAFTAFLKRSKLETDLASVVSAQRKARALHSAATSAAEQDWAELEAQRVAKLAEIDAL